MQNARLFSESKEFVDMKIKDGLDEEQILANFAKLQDPTPEDIDNFVREHFDPNGSEFENYEFPLKPNPKFLERISSPELREFGENVHKIWPQLGRKVKEDVSKNNDLYSFIPLNYTTVVPTGHDGRFREMYYWDSYWHIRGLIVSEAYQTVFDLLKNFKSLVDRFGFIPNGTRKYYTTRSQPPFYSTSVSDFYEHCKENPEAAGEINMSCDEILEFFLPSMEAELNWWLENRKIDLENGEFGFAYGCPITVPRKGFNKIQQLEIKFSQTNLLTGPKHILTTKKCLMKFQIKKNAVKKLETSLLLPNLDGTFLRVGFLPVFTMMK